jgi:hypothetical protein
LYNLIGLSSPILILVAIRIHKPEPRAPWFLFALGQFLLIMGDVLAYNYQRFFHTELQYPAVSDLFYPLVYPCLALGLVLLGEVSTVSRDATPRAASVGYVRGYPLHEYWDALHASRQGYHLITVDNSPAFSALSLHGGQ